MDFEAKIEGALGLCRRLTSNSSKEVRFVVDKTSGQVVLCAVMNDG